MNKGSSSPAAQADREILITRLLDAPRELVWRAFTQPEHLACWYGPEGFRTKTHGMDLRVGGVWRYVMIAPDGREFENRIVYDEIEEPARLVYTYDDGGETGVEAARFRTVVTLVEDGEGTRLTMRTVFPSRAERERIEREYGALEGGLGTVRRLGAHVAETPRERLTIAFPSEKEIVLRRAFDAPRAAVFEAMSKPEHIRRWWGPRNTTLTECEMDFRVGGTWRFVMDGVHPFRGEYLEIVPPERIVQTFVYDVDGIREYPSTETMTLEEREGRTILTTRVRYLTQQARDGHFQSGMEIGAAQTFDRLEELVTANGAMAQGTAPR